MELPESPSSESTGQCQARSDALERVSDGVVSLDHNLQYTYVNARAAELLDTDAESLLGENIWKAFPNTKGTKAEDAIEQAVETGQTTSFQRYNRDLEKWWEVTVHPDETGITVVFSDITDKKERMYSLKRAETVFQNAQDGLFVIDIEDDGETFRVNQANPAYRELIGASAEDVEGRTIRELADEDSGAIRAKYRECVNETTALEYEEYLSSFQNGSWWETRITPVSVDGTVTEIVGSARNITDRKEREQELRRKTRALDNAPIGISITDPSQEDNPMTYVNEKFTETTGYGEDVAVGRNCRFLQGEATDPAKVTEIRNAVDQVESVETTLRNYRTDGTEFWNQLSIAPVRGEDGELESFVGFQKDVTERKERKKRLQTHELIIQAMNDVAFLVDDDERIRFANDAALDFADVSQPTITDQPIGELIEPIAAQDEDATRFTDAIDSLIGDDDPDVGEWVQEPDGTETLSLEFDFDLDSAGKVYTEQRFVPVELYDGKRGVAVISRDITNRREKEQEIQTHLLQAQEVGNVGSWYIDPDTGDLQLSDESYRILGLEPGTSLTYSAFLEMVHPEDREAVDSAWGEALEDVTHGSEYRLTDGSYEIEHRISVDDEIRWLQTRAEVNFGADGKPESGIGVIRDITERARQTRQIRAQKQRYESLFNSIGGAIVVTDTDGRIQNSNPGFTEMFCYDIDDIEGSHLSTITDDGDDVDRLLSGQDAPNESLILDYRKKSGQVVPGESRSTPLRTHDEKIRGHVVHIIDVSEQQENHEQLQVLGRIFRHNIKNDMNVIIAQAQLLQQAESHRAIPEAEKILEKSRNFVTMAKNQQKITRLLTERQQNDTLDLAPIANKVVADLQTQYPEATLNADFDTEAEYRASTVPEINDAIRELAQNAIVHSEQPDPTVDIQLRSTETIAEIRIEDDGPGIPEQVWDVLIGDREIDPLHHGTGLGLWVVNQVVRQSNGTLTLEKNDSRGASLVVRLPVD